jgi:hypothetical protein
LDTLIFVVIYRLTNENYGECAEKYERNTSSTAISVVSGGTTTCGTGLTPFGGIYGTIASETIGTIPIDMKTAVRNIQQSATVAKVLRFNRLTFIIVVHIDGTGTIGYRKGSLRSTLRIHDTIFQCNEHSIRIE